MLIARVHFSSKKQLCVKIIGMDKGENNGAEEVDKTGHKMITVVLGKPVVRRKAAALFLTSLFFVLAKLSP